MLTDLRIPYDNQLEMSLLAWLIYNPHMIRFVADSVKPNSFYSTRNRFVYQTALDLWEAGELDGDGQRTNHLIVETALAKGQGENVTAAYLGEIIDQHAPHLREYEQMRPRLAKLRGLAAKRWIMSEVEKVQTMASNGHSPAELGEYMRGVLDLYDKAINADNRLVSIADAVDAVVAKARRPKASVIPFGFESMDKPIEGGLVPGDLAVILARTRVGKTTLMCNIVDRLLARDPHMAVLFVTLEMPVDEVAIRLAQMRYNLERYEVLERFGGEDAAKAIVSDFMKDHYGLKFLEAGNLAEIDRQAERMRAQVVLVDHLQHATTTGGRSRYEAIADAVIRCKEMAKRRKAGVFLASQVGRERGGNGAKRVPLDAARDAGQIEENADVLMGLWRPSLADEKSKPGVDDLCWEILKNRRGYTTEGALRWHMATAAMWEAGEPADDTSFEFEGGA